MKKLFFAIGLLLTVSATPVFAGADDENATINNVSVVPTAKGAAVSVSFDEASDKIVKVNIYNAAGKRIYSDRVVGNKSFKRDYNFEKLSAGKYTVELVSENGVVKEEIAYAIAPKVKTVDARLQQGENGVYSLTVSSVDNAPVYISVYDNRNNVIHTEKIEAGGAFKKDYNLSRIHLTGLRFNVVSGNDEVSLRL